MRSFRAFKKNFKQHVDWHFHNQAKLVESTEELGDSMTASIALLTEAVTEQSENLGRFIKLNSEMLETMAKYFKLELEFTQKEIDKLNVVPSEHDALF